MLREICILLAPLASCRQSREHLGESPPPEDHGPCSRGIASGFPLFPISTMTAINRRDGESRQERLVLASLAIGFLKYASF